METVIMLDEIRDRLKAKGLAGLFNCDGPCGCTIDDLAPCGECNVEDDEEWINGCEAGYKHVDPRSKFGDWIISRSEAPPTPEEFDNAFSNC